MNPFNYSLAEVSKALIALIGALGFAAFYLVNTGWDPALIPALQALVPAGLGVIAAFAATNHTPGDVQKALLAMATSVYGVLNVLGQHAVSASTQQAVAVIIGYAVVLLGIYWKSNA